MTDTSICGMCRQTKMHLKQCECGKMVCLTCAKVCDLSVCDNICGDCCQPCYVCNTKNTCKICAIECNKCNRRQCCSCAMGPEFVCKYCAEPHKSNAMDVENNRLGFLATSFSQYMNTTMLFFLFHTPILMD